MVNIKSIFSEGCHVPGYIIVQIYESCCFYENKFSFNEGLKQTNHQYLLETWHPESRLILTLQSKAYECCCSQPLAKTWLESHFGWKANAAWRFEVEI